MPKTPSTLGGKPNKGTSADKRLKENQTSTPTPKASQKPQMPKKGK